MADGGGAVGPAAWAAFCVARACQSGSGTRPDGGGGGKGPAVESRGVPLCGGPPGTGPAESWLGPVGLGGTGSRMRPLPGSRGWERFFRWYSSAAPDGNGKPRRPTDAPGPLGYPFLVKVTAAACAAIVRLLAGGPALPRNPF